MRHIRLNHWAALLMIAQVVLIFATVFLYAPPIPPGKFINWLLAGMVMATLYSAALIGFVPAFIAGRVKAMQWFLFVAPIYFIFYVLMTTGSITVFGASLSALCLVHYVLNIAAIRQLK